jgi:hypothetical protein
VPARGKTCTTGAEKMIAQSVAEVISRHVKLTTEGIDCVSIIETERF